MSSNIKVQRVCEYCGKGFTARTTVTRTCSDSCAKRLYKHKQRVAKIEVSNNETLAVKTKPIEELKGKEFLTVRQVSKLINCSRQTVYNLINTGNLKAVNILKKKTLVKRSDLDKMFEQPRPVMSQPESQPEQIEYNIANCYTTGQVREKYGISENGLSKFIIRHNIPKFRKGWFAYVPKSVIDKLLG
jgi:excisionase family DNA binding protein